MHKILLHIMIISIALLLSACDDSGLQIEKDYSNKGYEKIDSSLPISDQYDPEQIAHRLVAQEMENQQISTNNWKITHSEIFSDKEIDNLADYDKPVGKMRVVWVTGYVEMKVSGTNIGENFDLEMYKLEGDNKWYIDTHWGVLKGIKVPEMPQVDESNYQLSTGDSPFGGDTDVENDYDEQMYTNDDNDGYFARLEERYLQYVYDHFAEVGLLEYLEGAKFFIKDIDMFEYPASISDKREYTYYLDASLNSAFDDLTENEQFKLLANVSIAEYYEYYEGNQFTVATIELFSDTDIFTISSGSLNKNEDSFWSQLENPYN